MAKISKETYLGITDEERKKSFERIDYKLRKERAGGYTVIKMKKKERK